MTPTAFGTLMAVEPAMGLLLGLLAHPRSRAVGCRRAAFARSERALENALATR